MAIVLARSTTTGRIEETSIPAAEARLYLADIASDVAGYMTLSPRPSNLAESDDTADITAASEEVTIDEYVTDPGKPGLTVMPAGAWTFHVWRYVSSVAGSTYLKFYVYKRDTSGTETAIFNVTTPSIEQTSATLETLTYITTSDTTMTATDRIVVKVKAYTTSGSTITVHLLHEGTTHVTWVDTPIPSTPILALQSRRTATYTTGSLADDAAETGDLTLAPGYRIIRIATDIAARVQIYATAALRTADASRAAGTDPTGEHGVILDAITTASVLTLTMSPQVDGTQLESTPSSAIPIRITNLSGATDTVTATFTWIRTE